MRPACLAAIPVSVVVIAAAVILPSGTGNADPLVCVSIGPVWVHDPPDYYDPPDPCLL